MDNNAEGGVPNAQPEWFKSFADKLNLISVVDSTVKGIDKRLHDLKNTVEFSATRLNDVIKELNSVKTENNELKVANTALKKDVDAFKSQVIYIESHSRRNNLLFKGVEESENETWEDCENKLLNILNETLPDIGDINFERVHRIGDKAKQIDTTPRELIAKFSSYKQRDFVWANRSKFKGTNLWISEDYPQAIKQNRQKLFPYLQAAKRSSEIKHSSLKLDRLYINNKQYTVKNLHEIPDCLKLENSSIITADDSVVFASKYAVFSNLHVCPIKIEGQIYNSTEQYIQWAKANLFNDEASAANILKETDTFKQMMLGKKIKHYKPDVWKKHVRDILVRANNAKYLQHQYAREALIRTQGKKLGEATIDSYFGIGQRLTSKTVSDISTWSGENVMGSVLEEIREKWIVP